MAGIRITDLDNLGQTPSGNDVIVIVDVDADVTKKVTVTDLISAAEQQQAPSASQVVVSSANNQNTDFYLSFTEEDSATTDLKSDEQLRYNAFTNTLSSTNFSGAFSGDGSLLSGVIAENGLDNAIDSALGIRVFGETTIDSDLIVKGSASFLGVLSGDGSGLTGVTSTAVTTAANKTDAKILDSNGTHYLMLRSVLTGFDSVSAVSDLVYDPINHIFNAQNFSGNGSRLTNVAADSANVASNVKVISLSSSDSATYYPHLGSTGSGNDDVVASSSLSYVPSLGRFASIMFGIGSDWDIYESAGSVLLSHLGVKKMRLDQSGNLAIAGTLTQSATL